MVVTDCLRAYITVLPPSPESYHCSANCICKKRSLTVKIKGAHYKEKEGVRIPHGSNKKRWIAVLQLRQLAIGSVVRDAQGRDVKANLNLGGMKCLERDRQ